MQAIQSEIVHPSQIDNLEGNTPIHLLFRAIKEINRNKVTELLKGPLPLDATYQNNTAPTYAAFLGHWEILLLILKKISLDYSKKEDIYQLGTTLLLVIQAIPSSSGEGGLFQGVALLDCFSQLCKLEAHLIPAIWQNGPYTPLYFAVMNNNQDVIEKLCTARFPATQQQALYAPTAFAAKNRLWHLIPSLVEDRPNGREDFEQYGVSLVRSAIANERECVSLLLEHGKFIKQLDKSLSLLAAANNDDVDMLIQLIKHGADLCISAKGTNVIKILANKGCFRTIENLLHFVVQNNIVVEEGFWDYALFMVVNDEVRQYRTEHQSIIKALIKANANPSKPFLDYMTPTAFEYVLFYQRADLFPILYASPKMDIACHYESNSSGSVSFFNRELLNFITPRLIALMLGNVNNQPLYCLLPVELFNMIAILVTTSGYLKKTKQFTLAHPITRHKKTALLKDLKKIAPIPKKPVTQEDIFITNLIQADKDPAIKKLVHDYLDFVCFWDRQEQKQHKTIIDLLITHQLTTQFLLTEKQRIFQPDILKRISRDACIFEYKSSCKKPAAIIQAFIFDLEQKHSYKDINGCVIAFLNKQFYLGKEKNISDLLSFLIKHGLTTAEFQQALSLQYEVQVTTRNNAHSFLNAYEVKQTIFTRKPSNTINAFIADLKTKDYFEDINQCVKAFLCCVYKKNEQDQPLKKNVIVLLKDNGLTNDKFLNELILKYAARIQAANNAQLFLETYKKTKPFIESSKKINNLIETLSNLLQEKTYKSIVSCINVFLHWIHQCDEQDNPREQEIINQLLSCGLITDRQLKEILQCHAENIFVKKQASLFEQKYRSLSNQFFATNVLDLTHAHTAKDIRLCAYKRVENIYQNGAAHKNKLLINLLCQYALITPEEIQQFEKAYSPSVDSETIVIEQQDEESLAFTLMTSK